MGKDPSELTIDDLPGTDEMHHAIFDCIGVDTDDSMDKDFAYSLMMEIPTIIDMHVLSGPFLEYRDSEHKWGRRLTGITIIDHSHISYHAFSDKPMALIGVFSVEPFDDEAVADYVQGRFEIRDDQIYSGPVLYDHEK